ncbi:acetolactate synthase small subunit [Clostridium sp. YIM B02551]|uniref:acetolactate synthase small subunit n=1 Tax=Clostridium sp. YIM B02551 TaxID=2910679 RepID=UPI001EEB8907|nr:acetolactate synthase small subunit [Clostridium sp. YIM B02551]
MNNKYLIIELLVNNHPGVMSHITGLFARRAFNLEGILCGEVGDGLKSKMYLLVKDDVFLDQIIKQLKKLYDVLQVEIHDDYEEIIFKNPELFLKAR